MQSGEFSSAFCVVCGRFDRELVLRKSGLKCSDCIGRKSNKAYTQLQQQQAQFILSKSHNMNVGGGGAPPQQQQRLDSPTRRISVDMSCNKALNSSMNSASSPMDPLNWTTGSTTMTATTSGSGGSSMDQRKPNLTAGSGNSPVTNIWSLVNAPEVHSAKVNIDDIYVIVDEPKNELVATETTVLHKRTTETATTYRFLVKERQGANGMDIVSTRHRFKDAYKVFHTLKLLGANQLPDLPEKKLFSRFNPQFIEERRVDLEKFVNACVANAFFVRHPELVDFLGVNIVLNMQELEQKNASASSGKQGSGELPLEELRNCKRGTLLGKGTFGSVYLGLLPSTSNLIAVKVLRISSVHQGEVEKIKSELELLRNLEHPNIVRFLGSVWDGPCKELSIFTEYMECGSVASMVHRFGALPMPVIQKYLKQMCEGLAYLHSLNVVHRDIKGDNILVTKDGSIKLADFGCSGHLEQLDLQKDGCVTGTPMWMAPEVMRGEAAVHAADIWSLGCVGIEVLQRKPWHISAKENVYTALYRIQKSRSLPEGLPTEGEIDGEYRKFLVSCFHQDPSQRPSAKELLSHPFFQVDYVEADDGSPLSSTGRRKSCEDEANEEKEERYVSPPQQQNGVAPEAVVVASKSVCQDANNVVIRVDGATEELDFSDIAAADI